MRRGTVLAVLLGLLAATAAAEPPATASRLAAKSLLLDAVRAGGRIVAVGEWGHVLLSDDGGASWRQAAWVPTQATLTDLGFVDAHEGWAVGHDGVILHTRDGGERWELQRASPEDEAPLLSVCFLDRQRGFAVGAFGLLLATEDGGEHWQRRALGGERPAEGEPPEDPHLNHVFRGSGDSLFIAAEFGAIFRSRGGGRAWERLQSPYRGSLWGGLRLDDAALLVFGMRGHVLRSEDQGASWWEVESGTDQSLQDAAFLSDGRLVVVGLGGTVLESTDGGRSFSARIEADRRGIASVAEGAGGRLLLFGEAGVHIGGSAGGTRPD